MKTKDKGKLSRMIHSVKLESVEVISYALLALGTIALVTSIVYSSPVLAFIGLGITFWGALLLFIKPTKYVQISVVDSMSLSYLKAINQIITNSNYRGKAIYLPPKYAKTPKGGIMFIPSKNGLPVPAAKEIAQEKVFLENPKGICMTPLGLDLANLFEKELGKDFAEVDLNYLRNNLPKLLTDDLEIAEDVEINTEDDIILARITESIFRKSSDICNSIGCPLCSSIAVALTRALKKPVIIEKTDLSESKKTTETYYYRILEE